MPVRLVVDPSASYNSQIFIRDPPHPGAIKMLRRRLGETDLDIAVIAPDCWATTSDPESRNSAAGVEVIAADESLQPK